MEYKIEGRIVDIQTRKIFEGSITVENGVITAIKAHKTSSEVFILPGFIDAHVHIESSMLTPVQFGKLVVARGTVAIVTDPHEIANVMGLPGIDFMIENSKASPIKTFFTIPSCVPATPFDSSGSIVSSADVEQLAASGQFVALSEVMNVPGVLSHDKEMLAKIHSAHKHQLPIDGHAPALSSGALLEYVHQGITTDHECITLHEAQEKIGAGMKILIREGSAARNYEALKLLIKTHPHSVLFCTDDAHPNETIARGHIDKLVKMAIGDQFDLFDVLQIASINPIHHYKLDVGQLRVGDKADFIVVDNLTDFNTQKVYINGREQYGVTLNQTLSTSLCSTCDAESSTPIVLNNFVHDKIALSALKKELIAPTKVISLVKNELLTTIYDYIPKTAYHNFESDSEEDIAKIIYINRYANGTPQVAFCRGFSLQSGAFASSIAHDSHNILAVGSSDKELLAAINAVIAHQGGLAVSAFNKTDVLPLPIGGIMSEQSGEKVALAYENLSNTIAQMGCRLTSPFMTLSFLSLVVIPGIKIGERGLFSYSQFNWINE